MPSWVADKIGVAPATDSDKQERLLALRMAKKNEDDEEFEETGSNKSLCVSLCVLAFSIPALIGGLFLFGYGNQDPSTAHKLTGLRDGSRFRAKL